MYCIMWRLIQHCANKVKLRSTSNKLLPPFSYHTWTFKIEKFRIDRYIKSLPRESASGPFGIPAVTPALACVPRKGEKLDIFVFDMGPQQLIIAGNKESRQKICRNKKRMVDVINGLISIFGALDHCGMWKYNYHNWMDGVSTKLNRIMLVHKWDSRVVVRLFNLPRPLCGCLQINSLFIICLNDEPFVQFSEK